MPRNLIYLFLTFHFSLITYHCKAWGFYAHKRINHLAVYTLPEGMLRFYKHHIQYITDAAVNPDKRRNQDPEEAGRHYIDIDVYGDSALAKMPREWGPATLKYPIDTLKKYGTVPWHAQAMVERLAAAMRAKDAASILYLSADLGHYASDLNVPLHTTQNYDGQMTGQKGIHSLWESRLPELFGTEYTLFTGPAQYAAYPDERIWACVTATHHALDSVLKLERSSTAKIGADNKFSEEDRGGRLVKTYTRKFSKEYHEELAGQVERRMKESIKLTGDLWYTAWMNAGQPNLDNLIGTGPELPAIEPTTPAQQADKGLRVEE